MNNRGFTLIELLIVVAIIGILAAVATTAYIGTIKKSARSEAYSNLESLRLLEEQFFAENARYTTGMGTIAGNTIAIRDANLALIQDTANDADIDELRGFRPGNDTNFSYWIIQNNQLNTPVATPPVWAPSPVGTLCFVAVATGITGSRVCPDAANCDMFAIDCNNNRNF